MADAVEREVMLGVGRIGIIQVDVAGGTVGRVTVEDQAVHVVRGRPCELCPQERHERDDRVLVQLARPILVETKFGRGDGNAIATRLC